MKTNKLLVILCAALFLVLPLCTAELDVRVSSYNSTSQLAKIEVVNTNAEDYSGLMLTIDNRPAVLVTMNLKSGNSALISQIVEPGTYNIILTTKEGVRVEKPLSFLKDKAQLAAEVENSERLWKLRQEELERRAQEDKERLDNLTNEEVKKKEEVESVRAWVEGVGEKPEPKKTDLTNYLLIISGILLLLILVLLIFRFKKKGFSLSGLENVAKKEPLNKEEVR